MGRILAKYPATGQPARTKAQIISDLKAKKLSVEKVWARGWASLCRERCSLRKFCT